MIAGNQLYEFTFGLFLKFADMANVLYEFLFTKLNIIGATFQVWQLIGGGIFVTLLIAWLVKSIAPLV